MAKECRAVSVANSHRQFGLFPREVVRKLTRTRRQRIVARLEKEKNQVSEWPVKPKGIDEADWYRQIERGINLSVISADPQDSICEGCGVQRVIYQAMVYPGRAIVARCKDCCLMLADGSDHLWVRTEAYLREKWTRDGKDPVKSARAKARHTNT